MTMRRLVSALLLGFVAAIPAMNADGVLTGFAQTTNIAPQGDEFNASTFTAPFVLKCGQLTTGTCPDVQSPTTWSLKSR